MVFLYAFGGYLLTSFLFLKYPTILHRRKHVKFRPKHISHRGGAAERIENTMEAFSHAEQVGTDMFELDCQLTRDEQVVVCHDDKLYRTCGVDILVSETDYHELPMMKEKIKVDFLQCLISEGKDRQIPLLEDVFKRFPNMPINIDVKADNDTLIKKIDGLIRAYHREDLTVWGNKSTKVSDKLYKTNPNVPLFFPLRQVLIMVALFWTGLLPFVSLRESLLEITIPGLLLEAESIFHIKFSRTSRLFFWVMDKLMMRPSLFNHLDKRGIQTNLWVLNREQDFERAFSLGATGVMTDRITLLRNYLDSSSHSEQNCRSR